MGKKLLDDNGIGNALDSIGCACSSCESETDVVDMKLVIDHNQEHSHGVTALDSISCGCSGCDDNETDKIIKKVSRKKSFLEKNMQLIFAFIIFFYGIFSKHTGTTELIIFLLAYILIARSVIITAIKNIFKGNMLDENFLMAIASIVAFILGDFAEGVAVMLFYRVGQLTEDYALNKSKKSISALLDIKPDFANLKTKEGLKIVDPNKVNVGDTIVIKPGEKVPLDGVVLTGESTVDTAMITGESLPSRIEAKSNVYSGTMNISAVIEVEVTKTFANSTVSKILQLVEKANFKKAKTEKFITKFAKVYTPVVVIAAGLLALVPPLFFGGEFSDWIYRGATFLVVSCPCALVISVPLGFFGGIGGAAKAGILIKGGNYLEVLKDVGIVVLDKTGTLTKGNFKLRSVKTFDLSEEEVIRLSAHLEFYSNHPIAKAIVSNFDGVIDESIITNVSEVPGKGLIGLYENNKILIGNDALLKENNIATPKIQYNGTTLFLVINKKIQGILSISDEIKEGTKDALIRMKQLGVDKIVMLTGDRKAIADEVGKELDIDEVYAELLPSEKLEKLEELMENYNKKVIFVGDGINDAPVLSRADAGIAMGLLGSDVAVESADIVLMTDEISKIPDGIKMAKFTSGIIWQNIILALGIKLVIMILSALGITSMWIAVFGDVGVAFLAIINSGRAIYSYKKVIAE